MGSTQPPRFVIVAGPPLAGKSTVAGRLSRALAAPHLEMDQIRARILPTSDQRVEHRDLAYRAMHLAAELMIPWCRTVILDATYSARDCRVALLRSVERAGAALFVVECHVSAAAAVKRFRHRGSHPAVDLDVSRVASLADEYPYSPGLSRVCTVESDSACVRILEQLGGPPLDEEARTAWSMSGQAGDRSVTIDLATPGTVRVTGSWQ